MTLKKSGNLRCGSKRIQILARLSHMTSIISTLSEPKRHRHLVTISWRRGLVFRWKDLLTSLPTRRRFLTPRLAFRECLVLLVQTYHKGMTSVLLLSFFHCLTVDL